MASTIIHLAVAKELEKKLNIKNKYDYYLGSIAPDLSKQIGESKEESHFLKNSYKESVPNINLFTKKYPEFKKNPFDLGYYIHLYTDKLWFENFMDNITFQNSVKLLDGTILETSNREEIQKLIYSDYTNLNITLIDEYNMDLSLFYEEFRKPKTTINEIDINKLDFLINKMGILIENSKEEKLYTFDIFEIKKFISQTVEEIERELNNK